MNERSRRIIIIGERVPIVIVGSIERHAAERSSSGYAPPASIVVVRGESPGE